MEPASTIIKKLGGEAKVAGITNVSVKQAYCWQYPKERRGTGGIIPHWHVPKLLAYARENEISLSAADFSPVVENEAA